MKIIIVLISIIIIGTFNLNRIEGIDNGVALTPAMGWNSWNYFGCNINESIIMEMATQMVKTGLINYGYQYICIDDCWAYSRNSSTGVIQPDPVAFPNGIKYIADFVHSLGLKMGIYTDASPVTWQNRPGSFGYEELDAQTYAEWGIDYVKEDWMKASHYNWTADPVQLYTKMANFLNETGRPIYFSICEWGVDEPWTWAPSISNSWRTAFDIQDNWERIMAILDQQINITGYSGIGAWNDMDILEVGNGGMTDTEDQTHFMIWCMLSSPLLAGNNLSNMTEMTLDILTAVELIEVNQDPMGVQARRVYHDPINGTEIWIRPLFDGTHAALLLNRNDTETLDITLDFTYISIPVTDCVVRDLWIQTDLGVYNGSFVAQSVPPHGSVVLKILSF